MTPIHEITAATGAGCASTLIGHPLDTIKVHLQTNPSLRGTIHATRALVRSSSPDVVIGSLFRGIGPPLAAAVAMNTVMFSAFRAVKVSLPDDHGIAGSFLAGTVSGVATACVSTPTDYVKIQSQLTGR
eukprot:CAMPEP_0172482954 /NCGR_PEP_ID=MMETSP1066-20121228/9704_1 /TAXON_ID=671091 /ORGANISM="Coscinodiscus wailesii, Strain CCMP2513" /LENGTH=128 /DNA_ID=CAMNT_0013246527 /DNA_START=66 /DNA_END=449 /DNA_ORIENTATION=-